MKPSPLAALAAAALTISSATGLTDNFDDGNDDGWTVFDPLAEAGVADPVEVTLADGTYRLKGSVPAVPDAGPSRVFAFLEDEVLTDFYVAVDLVDWDDTNNQAMGIIARAENISLGQTTGYVCNYDPNQSGSRPGGQFQINYVEGEAAPSGSTMAAINIELINDHSYRMIFFSKDTILTAALYDLTDLTTPVALIQSPDGDDRAELYESGFVGLFNFYRGNATDPEGSSDATFDNFVRETSNPHKATWPLIGRGIPGNPNVTSLQPGSGESFASSVSGIETVIDPAGESPIVESSISLVVNGADVTSTTTVATTEDGTSVSYPGLNDRTLYQARLTASTETGAMLVHEWRFDTFLTSDLNASESVVIEVENYNFESGKFLDDASPGTYRDKFGEFDIDYFDFDTAAQGDLRFEDFVGNRALLAEEELEEIIVDVVRPGVEADDDYVVLQTEGGEWMNFTREFVPADYNVYLRAACMAPQDVLLDLVSDATSSNQTLEPQGKFSLHSTLSSHSFEFFPLVDEAGSPVVLTLAGEQSLRLTLGGEDSQFETRHTTYLNYFALIPVGSSLKTFAIDSIDLVTTPTPGIRLTWPTIPGRSYGVDYSQTLQAPWLELSDIVAEEVMTTYTDFEADNLARTAGYYRVRRAD